MKPEFEVGLTHHNCIICLAKCDEEIILPKKLDKKTNEQIRKLHNQSVGFSKCDNCKESESKMPDGVWLIGVDESKSPPSDNNRIKPSEAYRTGQIIRLRKSVMSDLFEQYKGEPILFTDDQTIEAITKLVSPKGEEE